MSTKCPQFVCFGAKSQNFRAARADKASPARVHPHILNRGSHVPQVLFVYRRRYQACFVSYFVSLDTAAAGYFVSFQVSFRLGARDVTKRKESFGWLLKRNPNPAC